MNQQIFFKTNSFTFPTDFTESISLADSACKRAERFDAVVEPIAEMELLVNVTIGFDGVQDRAFKVCWMRAGKTEWSLVGSHDEDGGYEASMIVQGAATAQSGAATRGAPGADGALHEYCCEGLRIGELCLPAGLIVFLWVLLLCSLIGVCGQHYRQRSEITTLNESRQPEGKYSGFDLDEDSQMPLNTTYMGSHMDATQGRDSFSRYSDTYRSVSRNSDDASRDRSRSQMGTPDGLELDQIDI